MGTVWSVGAVEVERIPYFDTPLPAAAIGLEGVPPTVDWATPWLVDGDPAVGQAFWVIRSGGTTLVVDPCGASDEFLRAGPEALDHQVAAFDLFRSAGADPDDVDAVVLTHLDGIGMAALVDGEGNWTRAFERAPVVVSERERQWIAESEPMGAAAFAELDGRGAVETVAVPHQPAPGVTMRLTGDHSPGHCVLDIESEGDRAVLLGHLAVSPLHAARPGTLHVDPGGAWAELCRVLDAAHRDGALVIGSLWPTPGAARVVDLDPYRLEPAAG